MRKLILVLSVLFTTTLFSQSITPGISEMGGAPSCNWNLGSTITIKDGSALNIYATGAFGYYTFSASSKYAFFETSNNFPGTNNCYARIKFNKPGTYQISVSEFASGYTIPAFKTATVIVLPKWKDNKFEIQ